MKSTLWLLDPRPSLGKIVEMVEHGFQLSEASATPVMLEMRIRACHVQGSFKAKDNVPPPVSTRDRLADPARFDYGRLAHPPVTFLQEKSKIEERLPAARRYIVEKGLNEVFQGDMDDVGLILQGGLYNGVLRRLQTLGLADAFGGTRVPMLVLNVTHPLVPEQISDFCAGKRGVLILEEGNPEFIEHQVNTILRKADINTRIFGKDVVPPAGEYTGEVLREGLARFLEEAAPLKLDPSVLASTPSAPVETAKPNLDALPARPPQFCTGCPERPVFSAIKIIEEEVGKVHIAADIGCHAFATFEPFSMGNSILGYGMSLASAAAVAPFQDRRSISIMGDGGFWHNGLTSGVVSSLLNRGDSILIIMQNGYTSATGQQFIPNSPTGWQSEPTGADIESTLRTLGVPWLRRVRTYSVAKMVDTLRDALTTDKPGLKVIIADGECQLARQRRLRQENAEKLARGARVVTPRFGIDDEICTGDHSCIRLSGCPSLTVKPNPDPLRSDPVATVISSCVGCGLCGEVAHAASLCPSFYKAEKVTNPSMAERVVQGVRDRLTGKRSDAGSDNGAAA